jgi:WD40 repeat protein
MCLAIRDKILFGGTLGSVVIKWNVTTGLPLFIYRSQKRMIRAIALWKTYAISGGENTEISVWNVAANIMEPYAVIFDHQKAITSLLVYEDTLLSGSYDTTIRHWNLTTLQFLKFYLGESFGFVY